MEINLENAFLVVIKLSISPLVSSLDAVTCKIESFLYKQALKALEQPLLSTLLFSVFLILLIGTLTYSIIITAGFFCMSMVIVLIEGFVLSTIISLAFAITSVIFFAKIIFLGFIGSYRPRIESHQNM